MPPRKIVERQPKGSKAKVRIFHDDLREKRINEHTDKVWTAGIKAPIFASTVRVGNEGKTITRKTRLINGNAYKMAIQGAIIKRSAQQLFACRQFGVAFSNFKGRDEYGKRVDNKVIADDDESLKDVPADVPFSPGAKLMLEQFLADYVQEARIMADGVRNALGTRLRVTPEYLRMAFAELAQRTDAPGHGACCESLVVPVFKKSRNQKVKGAKQEEEEALGDTSAVAE